MIRATQISTLDIGGAGIAAGRLHRGLLLAGCDSRMLVLKSAVEDPTVETFAPPVDLFSRVQRRLWRRRIRRDFAPYSVCLPAHYELFSDDRSEYRWTLVPAVNSSEIVNLHWVPRLVDYTCFFRALPATTRVVWTMHDMNPFTGGCHYDRHCGRFSRSCGACPVLGSASENDLSRIVWKRKHRALVHLDPARLHLVAPSDWLAGEARKSSLLNRFPISTIPYGLDTETFAPQPVVEARRALGITTDSPAILFVSAKLTNPRKGFEYLLECLPQIVQSIPDVQFVSVGKGQPPDVPNGLRHTHLGEIHDEHRLAAAYSAADVFVSPSLQDNLPNTLLESIACGTPVVCFAAGGMREIVTPGTGITVPEADSRRLTGAILELLQDPHRMTTMRRTCRDTAVARYRSALQTSRYLSLYESLLES